MRSSRLSQTSTPSASPSRGAAAAAWAAAASGHVQGSSASQVLHRARQSDRSLSPLGRADHPVDERRGGAEGGAVDRGSRRSRPASRRSLIRDRRAARPPGRRRVPGRPSSPRRPPGARRACRSGRPAHAAPARTGRSRRCASRFACHPVGVDLEPVEQAAAEGQGRAGEQAGLGQHDPLGLPRPAVPLVLVDHALHRHHRVGPYHPGERDQVLGQFGVALVRHGDAAHLPGRERLAHLADLGRCSSYTSCRSCASVAVTMASRLDELGHPVAGGDPRRRPGRPARAGRRTRRAAAGRRSPQNSIVPSAPPSWTTSQRRRPSASRSRWRS